MKIAVTFFNQQKKNKKIYNYNKIDFKSKKKIKSNVFSSICSNDFKFSNFNLLFICIVCTLFTVTIQNTVFLSNNLSIIEYITITKDKILALNSMANIKNYSFSEKEEIEIKEENEQYVLMDEVAKLYNEQAVFGTITQNDVQVIAENNVYQKLNVCGIEVVNYSTNRNIDFVSIINSDTITFSKKSDNIVMYTTHTSESYANSSNYTFDYTSPRRTTDGNYNMLSIASEFASNLNDKGIGSICSLTPHDYGEYNSAYTNSRMTLSTLLEQNTDTAISIDVHRDAIEDLDFAPKVNIRGCDVASLMMVMGIGYDDSPNPYYEENLKLAFKIQLLANKVYPGLFRSIIIRNSVYNQDLKSYSFLIEVGASGNTIDEAKLSTRCLANLINLLYKD